VSDRSWCRPQELRKPIVIAQMGVPYFYSGDECQKGDPCLDIEEVYARIRAGELPSVHVEYVRCVLPWEVSLTATLTLAQFEAAFDSMLAAPKQAWELQQRLKDSNPQLTTNEEQCISWVSRWKDKWRKSGAVTGDIKLPLIRWYADFKLTRIVEPEDDAGVEHVNFCGFCAHAMAHGDPPLFSLLSRYLKRFPPAKTESTLYSMVYTQEAVRLLGEILEPIQDKAHTEKHVRGLIAWHQDMVVALRFALDKDYPLRPNPFHVIILDNYKQLLKC
jgi:hypothetical protein